MRLVALLVLSAGAFAKEGQTVLDSVTERVTKNRLSLPRYTCEEVIERSWFTGSKLDRTDRSRLDVAVGENGEMFSWHGDKSFRSGTIDTLIRSGPISSGTFSSFLNNIFTPRAATMTYTGNGRFTYAMPLAKSTFLITTDSGKTISEYEGYFLADVSTGKLKKLQVRSDKLPRNAHMQNLEMEVSYTDARLGEAEVELPEKVVMDVIDPRSDRTRSVTTYRNCHQFLSESVIRFDGDPTGENMGEKASEKPFTLPAGREVEIRLLSTIQPETAWAGDRIEGRLARNITGVAEKGTPVLGHLVRMETMEVRPPAYNIDLLFDELVLNGIPHPIHLEAVGGRSLIAGRMQLTVRDGDQAGVCRFRLAYKKDNLKNSITYWTSTY